MQLRFSHSLQDVYNGIGIVLSNREDNGEALPYLKSAIETYEQAIKNLQKEDKEALVEENFEGLKPVDVFLLDRSGDPVEEEDEGLNEEEEKKEEKEE